MAYFFQCKNCNDAWEQCYRTLISDERVKLVDSRNGMTRELLHVSVSIENPHDHFVYSREPAFSIAYAFVELICLLEGSNDARILNFWNSSLSRFAGKTLVYPGAYGTRLNKRYGFNQISNVLETLSQNPNSRQVVLLIWDPYIDLFTHTLKVETQDECIKNEDIPCNICSLIKIRDKKLYWTQIMRSNDILLGTPYDLFLFTTLQELFASWLSIDVGEYVLYCDSLHLYENDIAKYHLAYKTTQEIQTNIFSLSYRDTMSVIHELYKELVHLTKEEYEAHTIMDYAKSFDQNKIWRDINNTILAYVSRKNKDATTTETLISGIDNSNIKNCWNNWKKGKGK